MIVNQDIEADYKLQNETRQPSAIVTNPLLAHGNSAKTRTAIRSVTPKSEADLLYHAAGGRSTSKTRFITPVV